VELWKEKKERMSHLVEAAEHVSPYISVVEEVTKQAQESVVHYEIHVYPF
jgi:hypothetical protein